MSTTWLAYYQHVRQRLTFDRGFFKGAFIVAKLYCHFKFGAGRQKPGPNMARPTLAFFPQPAGPWYNIWLAVQNTKLQLTKHPENADYIFIFDDSTHSEAAANLPAEVNAQLINHRVTDISKSNVGRVFQKVFGYNLEIDPLTYEGAVVEKSDENGTHDGKIITCPIPASNIKPGYAYQKFIDSSFSGKTSEDLRVASVYGEVAAVFHKHKAFEKRFGTQYLSTDVKNAEEVFSREELRLISQFCDAIGLDFGAIDIMRDKHDGRIYIVDVNKTCMPVLSLPDSEQYRSLKMIGKVLEDKLLSLE